MNMTTNTYTPLHLNHTGEEAVLHLSGDITERLAMDFEQTVNLAFGYYAYDTVKLKINSPGGSLLGLTHITQTIERWRREGRCVETQTIFLAASAGAMLLALGEIPRREVQRHSSILFHHTRTAGPKDFQITAHAAQHLAVALGRMDQQLVRQMVDHISKGFDGWKGVATEGLARCALLKSRADLIAQDLRMDAVTAQIGPIEKVYRDIVKTKSMAPYIDFLEQRMRQDSSMDVREAYALALIDRVFMAPSLLAQARFGDTSALVNMPASPARRASRKAVCV